MNKLSALVKKTIHFDDIQALVVSYWVNKSIKELYFNRRPTPEEHSR